MKEAVILIHLNRKEKEVNELQQKIEEDSSEIAALQRKIRELEVCTSYRRYTFCVIIIHVFIFFIKFIYFSFNFKAKIEELEEDLENEKRIRQKVSIIIIDLF